MQIARAQQVKEWTAEVWLALGINYNRLFSSSKVLVPDSKFQVPGSRLQVLTPGTL